MHCRYCDEQPNLRSVAHCVSCGWRDRPLTDDDVCTACRAWASGARPDPDHEAVTALLAAVVERAVADRKYPGHLRDTRYLPAFCEDCDGWTKVCAEQYLDVITHHAVEHDGDPTAVFELVALMAAESSPLAA